MQDELLGLRVGRPVDYSLLYGLPVKTILADPEGTSMVFSNASWPKGAWIIIYGKAVLSPAERTMNDLLGRKLIDLRFAKELVSLHFDGGIMVTVGLKDDDYEGPERIQIQLPNGQTIVE